MEYLDDLKLDNFIDKKNTNDVKEIMEELKDNSILKELYDLFPDYMTEEELRIYCKDSLG